MKLKWKAAVAAFLLAGSIALAQDAPAQPAPSAASDTNASAMASAPSGTYIIGAEDTLHVAVWKEQDLTATLPVRPDGKISLPLLNDVQAAGMTPQQLSDSLTVKLKKYIS